MKIKLGVLVIAGVLTQGLPSVSLANESQGRLRFDGTIGGGFEQFSVIAPTSGFKINNGSVANIQGEKPFGSSPLYLTSGVTYLKTTGNLNYNYTSPTATYTATNVNYLADDFRFDVGLRLKFFNSQVIRPYVEGGGMAGYLQISYDSSLHTPAVVSAGSDYKTLENVLEFGYYAEGGMEFQIASSWGIRLAYHYLNSTTRSIVTLGNQNVSYTGNIYYGGIFWSL